MATHGSVALVKMKLTKEQLALIYGEGPWKVEVTFRDQNGTARFTWDAVTVTALDQTVRLDFNIERDTHYDISTT
jgi:hypothetical protein